MLEQDLKRRVIKTLKDEFPGCFIWKISDRWISGIPDILFIYKGVHIFFELKTDKGVVSKIQQYTIDKIMASGGYAYAVRSVEEVKRICGILISK
jgi:hypothetical protein